MDITYYFSSEHKNIHNPIKYKQIISECASKKIINLLEYTYLVNFLKDNGTIINLNWFIDIAKKINNEEFNNECIKLFENLFSSENGIIKTNNNTIINEITSEKNNFEFSNDQRNAIDKIINFLINYEEKTFGFYGYAGTGKTTTFVELTSYLLKCGWIKSIAYTAPTNKAVNIIKAKFRHHLKDIVELKTNIKYEKNYSMEDLLDILYKKGIKIEFITIHRLLNYKNDFDVDGERIFVQKGETNIKDYQLVIIDECSMIPLNIINHLFEDVRQADRNIGNNYKKIPKLIFTGDKAQLNAVGELTNVLFKINRTLIVKQLEHKNNDSKYVIVKDEINNKVDQLEKDIKNMKCIVMKDVMRSKIDNIINLCINVRQWLEKEIKHPEPRKYVGNGVYIYKHNPIIKKTENKWFKEYLKNFNNEENTLQTSNIILTWTNKQCDEYNNTVRKIIFKEKESIDRFEKGDILMLNDFYNIDETKINNEKDNKNRFYTSEQIKVMDINKQFKKSLDFTEHLPKSVNKMKNINHIDNKFKNIVKGLNSKTKRYYEIWKLDVNRLTDVYKKDVIVDTYQIIVMHNTCEKLLSDEKIYSANIIKEFRKNLVNEYKDQKKMIDNLIIRQLWRDWSKIFVEPFAKVNYGCSITTHKSQSSTYINAFIDVNDILLNNSDEEAKRCLYTALTRASNEVHLLV